MSNNTEKKATTRQELAIVKNVNDLPVLLPEMDKKELFNTLQESEPIANLTGKKFKILGIMPEVVQVPRNQGDDNGENFTPVFDDEENLVDRLRVTLITDVGVFHSFSVTFNKALAKALNVFGADYVDNTYSITMKMRGSGDGAKAYYVVKVV